MHYQLALDILFVFGLLAKLKLGFEYIKLYRGALVILWYQSINVFAQYYCNGKS